MLAMETSQKEYEAGIPASSSGLSSLSPDPLSCPSLALGLGAGRYSACFAADAYMSTDKSKSLCISAATWHNAS